MVSRSSWAGVGLTTAASILWGSTYPTIQIALEHYSPYTISFLRAVFATLTLLVYFVLTGISRNQLRLPKAKKQQTLLFGASMLGAAGFWTLLNLSIVFLEADTSSFLVALYPLIAIVLATIFLKEKLTAPRIFGVAVGIVGTFVLVAYGERAQIAGSSPLEGALIAVGAAFSWASYMIASRVLTSMKDEATGTTFTPEYVTFTTFAISLVPSFLIMAAAGLPYDWSGGGLGLGIVLYLGVVTSAVAFLIFNIGMKIIGVSRAAVNQLLFPAVAVLLSYPLLGATINLADLIGIVMIASGVIVAQLWRNRIRARERSSEEPS